MSLAKVRDMRSLSAGELQQKKDALEKELQDLRQKKVTGQLDKPHAFKAARRQIAQINTVQRENRDAHAGKQK